MKDRFMEGYEEMMIDEVLNKEKERMERYKENHKREVKITIPEISVVKDGQYIVHGPWGDFECDDNQLLDFLKSVCSPAFKRLK